LVGVSLKPILTFLALTLLFARKMCFRFNNRKNEFLFRDTMVKLIGSPNLEYKHLTAKVRDEAA